MRSEISLSLHPISPTSTTLIRPIQHVQGLVHGTQLPGGFWSCSFILPTSESDFWDWRQNRMLHRLLIREQGGQVIWEGRLEIIELLDFWTARLGFFGYWSNFTDARFETASGEFITYTDTANNIVIDFRDTHIHADTLQLSTANGDIASPGVTLTLDFGRDISLWEAIEQLLRYGDSNDDPVDLMIYEDQKIILKARAPTAVKWTSPLRFVGRFAPRVDWKDTANALNVAYESAGTVLRTGYTTDVNSIGRYIRRELHIPNIGTSNLASATARRATELELRKEPQQQTDDITLSQVFDDKGQPASLCRVRAGDVIRFPDFIPTTADAAGGTPTLDALRTFFITATECDHDRGQLRIRPDRDSQKLSRILARRGIR